jgi:thymidylate synthase
MVKTWMIGGIIMMQIVNDIRAEFVEAYVNDEFEIDAHGNKIIEMLGANFHADEPSIFGTPNQEYIQAEIAWYERQSTNIHDIYHGLKEAPKAWKLSSDDYGNINSNYGHLIFSEKYYNQYNRVLQELKSYPTSRRASMIYTRPSIWVEFNENGKSDFICTNSVTYYIRNSIIHCVVQMRSNDVVYGYRNDYAWQRYVLDKLANDLKINSGNICWQVQNLHVYEKHFKLIEQYMDKNNEYSKYQKT